MIRTCVKHLKVLSVQTNNIKRNFSSSKIRNMKLVQFLKKDDTKIRVGIVKGEDVIDVCEYDRSIPNSLLEILKNDDLEKLKCISESDAKTIPLSCVCLAAPITGMDKVIGVGLNYVDHCEEQKIKVPEVPMFFSKFSSCIVGPKDAVKLRTEVTKCVDWEVEMALVIGKKACNVKESDALNYVLGYTVAQDITARDWQKNRNGGQFLLGKSMDTFASIGPWIVTSDEIGDPQKLHISCSVNGVLKQDSNTSKLAHKLPLIISRLSSVMTLYPGDIILTGTPGGVGMYRNPPEYLKPGDVIESNLEKVGTLVTRVEKFES